MISAARFNQVRQLSRTTLSLVATVRWVWINFLSGLWASSTVRFQLFSLLRRVIIVLRRALFETGLSRSQRLCVMPMCLRN